MIYVHTKMVSTARKNEKSILTCVYSDYMKPIALATPLLKRFRETLGILSEEEIFLCKSHYNKVYRQMYAPIKCASCSAYPKAGSAFTHHSPNPHYI